MRANSNRIIPYRPVPPNASITSRTLKPRKIERRSKSDSNAPLSDTDKFSDFGHVNLPALGYILGVAPFVVCFLNLAKFCGWDIEAMKIVSSNLSVVNVTIQMIATILAPVGAVASVCLFAWIGRMKPRPQVYGLAIVTTVAISGSMLPVIGFLLAAAVGSTFFIAYMGRIKGRRLNESLPAYVSISAVIVHFLIFITINSSRWLPTEVIIMDAHPYVVTGYVLKDGDHDLAYVNEIGREPRIVRQENVKKRILCRTMGADDFVLRLVTLPTFLLISGSRADSGIPTCMDALAKEAEELKRSSG